MQKYDFLVVGAGLFGAVFAYKAHKAGKKVLVIDQRSHIGGNCYTEKVKGIEVHKYGAHIFHTDNEEVWKFINQFGSFHPFINSPIAVVGKKTYNLPFNMNTFSKVFGVVKPDDVTTIIDKERLPYVNTVPTNLEEQALKAVGRTIYELLIKNYTEKQWGKPCTELPADTIKRLPIRLTYDNNYFNDKYQGIPTDGYTSLIQKMLEGIEVRLNTKEKELRMHSDSKKEIYEQCVYTGMIDEFFDYKLGELEYRSLTFKEVEMDTDNFQGNAVMNYPSKSVKHIRTIEHKHFVPTNKTKNTIVSYEYSVKHKRGLIPYYPIQTKENLTIYNKYFMASLHYPKIHLGGRLGQFRYYDMDDTIENALKMAKELL